MLAYGIYILDILHYLLFVYIARDIVNAGFCLQFSLIQSAFTYSRKFGKKSKIFIIMIIRVPHHPYSDIVPRHPHCIALT